MKRAAAPGVKKKKIKQVPVFCRHGIPVPAGEYPGGLVYQVLEIMLKQGEVRPILVNLAQRAALHVKHAREFATAFNRKQTAVFKRGVPLATGSLPVIRRPVLMMQTKPYFVSIPKAGGLFIM